MSVHSVNFLVNYLNSNSGKTSLMEAAIANNLPIVRNIVSFGADLNIKSANEGKTALIYASHNCNFYMMKYLLRHGADINIQDDRGETALNYSIHKYLSEGDYSNNRSQKKKSEKLEIIKLLINNRADLSLTNRKNQTVESIAKQYKDERFYRFLKKYNLNNQRDLSDAIFTDNEHLVRIILRHKYKVNQLNRYGKTPLIEAVQSRNTYMMNVMIENDCEINMPDNDGNTALMYAIEMGSVEMITILLRNRANSSIRNKDEKYALLLAIYNQDLKIIELLTCKNKPELNCYIDEKAFVAANKTKNKKIINYFKNLK